MKIFDIIKSNPYLNSFYYDIFVTYVTKINKLDMNCDNLKICDYDYGEFIEDYLGASFFDVVVDYNRILKKYPIIIELYNKYCVDYHPTNLITYIEYMDVIHQIDDLNLLLRKEKLKHLMKCT